MSAEFFHTGEFFSLLCAGLWALAIVLFRRSGEQIAPMALNLFKDTVGLALFVATMAIGGMSFFPEGRTLAEWLTLLVSGVIGIAVADTLLFASLNRLGAGRSAIVDCLYSPLVVLCSALYLHEPIGGLLLVALGLMVGAILVGTWSPRDKPLPEERREIHKGVGLGILSMLFMAVGIVMAKPVLNVADAWWATTVRLVGGVAFLAVQALLPRYRAQVAFAFRPGKHWRAAIPAAVIGAYAALFFWILGMKLTHTTVASVLNQSSNVLVLPLAWLILKEPLTPKKIVAIVMGFAGAVLAVL